MYFCTRCTKGRVCCGSTTWPQSTPSGEDEVRKTNQEGFLKGEQKARELEAEEGKWWRHKSQINIGSCAWERPPSLVFSTTPSRGQPSISHGLPLPAGDLFKLKGDWYDCGNKENQDKAEMYWTVLKKHNTNHTNNSEQGKDAADNEESTEANCKGRRSQSQAWSWSQLLACCALLW